MDRVYCADQSWWIGSAGSGPRLILTALLIERANSQQLILNQMKLNPVKLPDQTSDWIELINMRCFQSSPSLVFRVFQLASLRVSFPFFIFTVCFARPDKWINGIRVDWLDPIDINVGCIEKLTRRVHFVRYFCCCCLCGCVCVCVCVCELSRNLASLSSTDALAVNLKALNGRNDVLESNRFWQFLALGYFFNKVLVLESGINVVVFFASYKFVDTWRLTVERLT